MISYVYTKKLNGLENKYSSINWLNFFPQRSSILFIHLFIFGCAERHTGYWFHMTTDQTCAICSGSTES